MFKPFVTTRPQGTGLGLAIARRTLDARDWAALDKKYLKYLNFIKTKPMEDAEKICLSMEEERNVDRIIQRLLQYA